MRRDRTSINQSKKVPFVSKEKSEQYQQNEEYNFLKYGLLKEYKRELQFRGFKNTPQTMIILALLIMQHAVDISEFASEIEAKNLHNANTDKIRAFDSDEGFLQKVRTALPDDLTIKQQKQIMLDVAKVNDTDRAYIGSLVDFISKKTVGAWDSITEVTKKFDVLPDILPGVEAKIPESKPKVKSLPLKKLADLGLKIPEESFDEIFAKAKSKIRLYKATDYEKALEVVRDQIFRKIIAEGNEESVKFFLENVREIFVYDPSKLSYLESIMGYMLGNVAGYNPTLSKMMIRADYDGKRQRIGEADHEIRHFEQFHYGLFPNQDSLKRCLDALDRLQQNVLKCIKSVKPSKDCKAVSDKFEHRSAIAITMDDEFLVEEIANTHKLRTSYVQEGNSKIYKLESVKAANGKDVPPTKEQEKAFNMLYNIASSLSVYNKNFLQAFKDRPTDRAARYDTGFFDSVGKSYQEKFDQFAHALVELEAYIVSALPYSMRESLCPRRIETEPQFMKDIENWAIYKNTLKAKEAEEKLKQQPSSSVSSVQTSAIKEVKRDSIEL